MTKEICSSEQKLPTNSRMAVDDVAQLHMITDTRRKQIILVPIPTPIRIKHGPYRSNPLDGTHDPPAHAQQRCLTVSTVSAQAVEFRPKV